MRLARAAIVGVLVIVVALGAWWFLGHRASTPTLPPTVTVYYPKLDGTTLVPWSISLGPAGDRASVAFYVAVQTVAGPPSGVDAVRFPNGTRVRSVELDGRTAVVDLAGGIERPAEGSFTEAAVFKALVYSMTELPGIDAVRIRIGGRTVATVPGGHVEIDEPLTRRSF
jgi:spore germination protein GerM